MLKIQYRPATIDDTAFARNLHRLAYKSVIVEQFGEYNEDMQSQFFARAWVPQKSTMILVDELPIGFYRRDINSNYIKLEEIQLLPEYQSKGIGSTIIKQLIQEAQQLELALRLQVLKKNRAQQLYLRLGFKQVGVSETHYLMELSK